jgi:hypothetical protein
MTYAIESLHDTINSTKPTNDFCWKETLSTTSTSPKTTKHQYGSDNNNQHYTSSDRNCQQNHAIIFLSIPKDRHQLLNKSSLSSLIRFDTFVQQTKKCIVKKIEKYCYKQQWLDRTEKICHCIVGTADVAQVPLPHITVDPIQQQQQLQKNSTTVSSSLLSLLSLPKQNHYYYCHMEQQFGLDWQALTITMLQHGTYLDPYFLLKEC